MDAHQIEEQRVESIKNFWSNNKNIVILMIVLFTVGFFGVKYYKHHKEVVAEKASFEYGKLQIAINTKDITAAKTQGNLLLDEYKGTPYAELAALKLAKIAFDENNVDIAQNKLNWVLKNSNNGPAYHIAVIRLARLYRNNNEYDKALALLDRDANGFGALYDEVKGDIYYDQRDYKTAKKLYSKAMQGAPKTGATPWLKLKLENLAGIDIEENSKQLN